MFNSPQHVFQCSAAHRCPTDRAQKRVGRIKAPYYVEGNVVGTGEGRPPSSILRPTKNILLPSDFQPRRVSQRRTPLPSNRSVEVYGCPSIVRQRTLSLDSMRKRTPRCTIWLLAACRTCFAVRVRNTRVLLRIQQPACYSSGAQDPQVVESAL